MKATLRVPAILLASAIVLIVTLHWYYQPDQPEQGDQTQRIRQELALIYIGSQSSFETLVPVIKSQLEASRKEVAILEAIATLFALENMPAEVTAILEVAKNETDYDPRLFNYAFNYGEDLPYEWESMILDDWFGAQIAALVQKQLGDEVGYAKALVQLRQKETKIKNALKIRAYLSMFTLLGMGMLISMFISGRHFKRMGRAFFPLPPLFIPLNVLFHFTGVFLVSYVLIGYIIEFVLADQSYWLRSVVLTLLQAVLAVVLLKKLVFPTATPGLIRTLGLDNITMKFGNLFQIVGGVAILLTSSMIAYLFTLQSGWPSLTASSPDQYQAISDNPFIGCIYLLISCILVVIIEEVVFRGLLFRGILSVTKPWQALILSSGLYAILTPIAYWPYAFAMGFGLSVIYYRSANLLVNIWSHAILKCATLVLALSEIMS